MKLLLDTHIFLWYVTADPQLSTELWDALSDPQNEVYVSAASVWEAVIKHSLGKLPLPSPPATFLPEQRAAHRFISLPVEEEARRSSQPCRTCIAIRLTGC
jgi:PIN domain nuclease of toxin-antitoxin system